MSVNPSGSTGGTDYSDFEYQSVEVLQNLRESEDSTGDGNLQTSTVSNIEPLGGIGGLDNNEVAELVYLETTAMMQFADASDDQNVGTTGQVSGVVGANLSAAESSFPKKRVTEASSTIIQSNNIDESNISTNIRGGSEDRWFQLFESVAAAPFDDQTNGPGGSGGADAFHGTKDFRSLVGRGPVLDSSDNISIAYQGGIDDTIIDCLIRVQVHMVWDVAETSDAGRAFSVPN